MSTIHLLLISTLLHFGAPAPEEHSILCFREDPIRDTPSWRIAFQGSGTASRLDTLYLDVTCYQERDNTEYETEDCLYINVFTPNITDGSLPVMFFIHGGGFVGDSSRNYYADRVIDENIVYVVFEYRLGPFGFLSTQDEVIPGNNGLKDQQLALKWTHDNIHLFGGDPDKITIYGQSAGAASVGYHLLNQESQGLFRAAILGSGTSLNPWAYQRRAREIAFTTAAFINETFGTNRDSSALLEFLQSVDAKAIDLASEKYYAFEVGPQDTEIMQGFYWAPVIEVKNPDAFITRKMYGLLEAGNVVAVPILIGMMSEEYINYSRDREVFGSTMATYDDNLSWLVPNDMGVTDETNRTDIGRKIREIYTGGELFSEHLGDGVRYGSDTSFTRAIIKYAELYSQFADTYFYQFSYDGKLGHVSTQYEGAEHVGHGTEVKYIFCHGSNCDLGDYPDTDQVARDRLVKIYTDFVKYLNPTPEPSELLQNITWPLVSAESGDFFYVDINETVEIRNHPKEKSYGKWNDLYESLGFSDFDTY